MKPSPPSLNIAAPLALLLAGCDSGEVDTAVEADADTDTDSDTDVDADTDLDDTGPTDADADADGWTAAGGECDDGDPSVHPRAEEICGDADERRLFFRCRLVGPRWMPGSSRSGPPWTTRQVPGPARPSVLCSAGLKIAYLTLLTLLTP